MTNWLVQHEGEESGKRVSMPAFDLSLPVERGGPTVFLYCDPAQGEPKFRTFVPAILDELHVFTVRCQSRGELKGSQKFAVTGLFIIETEAVSFMPDPIEGLRKRNPGESRRFHRS